MPTCEKRLYGVPESDVPMVIDSFESEGCTAWSEPEGDGRHTIIAHCPCSDSVDAVRRRVVHDAPSRSRRVLNCVPSTRQGDDWTIDTAIEAGVADGAGSFPARKDLRATWWTVRDQKQTGACVGFAAADGVLRWHYVKKGLINRDELPSPRFIWMANKETDEITSFPTTFIEAAGTQTKRALGLVHRYGCALEDDLPMTGRLYARSAASFYTKAARLRITSYFNLGTDPDRWRYWIAHHGPILTRLDVDDAWMRADATDYKLAAYPTGQRHGGHAVALVGYTKTYFIVRNSWGSGWGRDGFAYASNAYAQTAFTEAYGVSV